MSKGLSSSGYAFIVSCVRSYWRSVSCCCRLITTLMNTPDYETEVDMHFIGLLQLFREIGFLERSCTWSFGCICSPWAVVDVVARFAVNINPGRIAWWFTNTCLYILLQDSHETYRTILFWCSLRWRCRWICWTVDFSPILSVLWQWKT
jgi:hypothetical protein